MKKNFRYFYSLIITFSLVLIITGCGEEDEKKRSNNQNTNNIQENSTTNNINSNTNNINSNTNPNSQNLEVNTVNNVDNNNENINNPNSTHNTGNGVNNNVSPFISLKTGEAVEILLNEGNANFTINSENENSEYILIISSKNTENSIDIFDYSINNNNELVQGEYQYLSDCSINSSHWQSMSFENEEQPESDEIELGIEKNFFIPNGNSATEITAKAVAAGTHTTVWADITENNPAELEDEFIEEFLTDFEDIILTRARIIFGTESDIDDDGRINLLFSPLTRGDSQVVAFFYGCDLINVFGCASTNNSEVLYLTPPNAIDPPFNTSRAIKEVLSHELQHLIHFNRKVLKNNLNDWDDNMYLQEGFGALAQDVLGYQAGNIFVTLAGLDEINDFSISDIIKNNGQYNYSRDGLLRGGAYLFVRWIYDMAGGDIVNSSGVIENNGGPNLVRTLFDSTDTMAKELLTQTEQTYNNIIPDFYTALALSNRDDELPYENKNSCFNYLPIMTDPLTERQRGANLYTQFAYAQLTGPALQDFGSQDEKIRSGGVEYILLKNETGSEIMRFSFNIDTNSFPSLRLTRIK